MSILKDYLGNVLEKGQFASIELAQPMTCAKGQITEIEEGGISTLHAPGKDPRMKPTRIVVMCPVELLLDPRAEVAPHIMIGKEPPQEEPKGE